MQAAKERLARPVTCLGGPAHSHQLEAEAWSLEYKVMNFKARQLGP